MANHLSQKHPIDQNDLFADSCTVANVNDEETLNNVFIKDVDTFIRHSFRHYHTKNSQELRMSIGVATRT